MVLYIFFLYFYYFVLSSYYSQWCYKLACYLILFGIDVYFRILIMTSLTWRTKKIFGQTYQKNAPFWGFLIKHYLANVLPVDFILILQAQRTDETYLQNTFHFSFIDECLSKGNTQMKKTHLKTCNLISNGTWDAEIFCLCLMKSWL